MTPESARLFFVSGLAFLFGIGGGALAMNAVHGSETAAVDPAKARPPTCAPCPQCPACPPPVDCGELGVIPPNADGEDEGHGDELAPSESGRAGLPASALPLAMGAVKEAIRACHLGETSLSGVVLLDLTATATAGGGFISDANITQTTGDMRGAAIAECVKTEAAKARFAWSGGDGELKFKLPVKVGR